MAKDALYFDWKVGELPFYYKPLSRPTNGKNIPDFLPFRLYIDRNTGTLMQREPPGFSDLLKKIYSEGSIISGMMDNEGIGKEYAEDFIEYLKSIFTETELKEKRVLEIGCGVGYLLHLLQMMGAEVLGVEPGKHGQVGSKKFNVPIIRDYFPSDSINEQFDIIILYCVLEHLKNPMSFLVEIKDYLSANGLVIIAVEDEEPYMVHGDVSFLFHEHFSYYTKDTLQRSLLTAKYGNVEVKCSSFSKVLYASARPDSSIGEVGTGDVLFSIRMAKNFMRRASIVNKRILDYVSEARMNNETVAIYVPGRAINALKLINAPIDTIRFFDDNPNLHGTYFAGFPIPVESRQQLLDRPTDRMIIMSNSFGEKIANDLSGVFPDRQSIMTWFDIFE